MDSCSFKSFPYKHKTILLKSKSETVPIKSVEVTNSGTEHKQETQQLHAACFRTRETAVEMQFIIRGNEILGEWERSTCSVWQARYQLGEQTPAALPFTSTELPGGLQQAVLPPGPLPGGDTRVTQLWVARASSPTSTCVAAGNLLFPGILVNKGLILSLS